MTTKDVLCERNFEGSLVCSTIIDGHRIHRIYMGYSRRYAISDFRKDVKLNKI